MAARSQPHAVVVPYPGSGNINPALQLAQLLHRHGVFITFVSTEHNLLRTQVAGGATTVAGGREGFRFETIPDGLLDADRDAQDYDVGLSKATTNLCAAPFRELVSRLRDGGVPGVPPVTCVLPTSLMSFALEGGAGAGRAEHGALGLQRGVAHGPHEDPGAQGERLPAAQSEKKVKARFIVNHFSVSSSNESCLTNGYLERTMIDWIPGMPPISLGDVSSFVRTTDPDDFGLWFNDTEANNCTKAGALIINTFDALEADVLAALKAEYPRIYTVGPLGSLLRHGHLNDDAGDGDTKTMELSLWKQDVECLAWLDAQEPGSVVYANFGSLTVLTADQLAEFAWGLAATRRSFLWVIREDGVAGDGGGAASLLPPEFLDETAARRRVATWSGVLRHRAVGCFLTHNGWNSTCEGLAAGVPMVCWPVFADHTPARCGASGRRLDAEVRREQVAAHVDEAMRSEAVRKSAARWEAEAEAAARPGGSSHENLLGMVKALGLEVISSSFDHEA
ncbi:hypothetical protein EJB05_09400, partial [Eragrostis curvula]